MEEKENNIEEAQEEAKISKRPYPYLDYNITDMQERNKIVHEIVNSISAERLTPYYLEELTKYLTEPKRNRKDSKSENPFTAVNQMVTINKRETSFQGLALKLQNGEDGIYNLMTDGDKNILFMPKIEFTEQDLETIPGLKELQEQIKKVEAAQKAATGKRKALLTAQLIEMRKDQYVLRGMFKPPVTMTKLTKSSNKIDLSEKIKIDETGEPVSNGLISFFDPYHICCLLCNYSQLKEDSYGKFENDLYYLMEDLDILIERTLKEEYPILYDIVIYKIDGLQGKEIIEKLKQKHNITYSVEYLSSLWRKKIPKLLSERAKKDWIEWHYLIEEKGKWKKCSRCHEVKLAHSYFYTKNKTSKDGWYSLCKECRNKKGK